MSTLSRWLTWRLLKAYATFAFSIALFFLVIDGFVNLEGLNEGDLLANLIQRYGRMLPELFYLLSPFITLMATLWVVAGLRRSNELIPLMAAGYSPRQIATPLLVLGVLFAPLCWADRELLLPRLADLRRAHVLPRYLAKPRPVADTNNGVLNIGAYYPSLGELRKARFVQLTPEGGEAFTILADQAEFSAERGGWTFYRGVVIERHPQAEDTIASIESAGYFLSTQIRLSDVEASIGSPMYLTAEQLKEQIERTPGFRHLAVQYYERFSQPLAGVVLLLLSIPLVLGGDGSAASNLLRFLACMGIAVAQFVLNTLCSELGSREVFSPAIAAFLPQAICAVIGGVLVWRAR